MEAVRCEMGVGVFASGTFCQLLTALVSSAAVKPEVRMRLLLARDSEGYGHIMISVYSQKVRALG